MKTPEEIDKETRDNAAIQALGGSAEPALTPNPKEGDEPTPTPDPSPDPAQSPEPKPKGEGDESSPEPKPKTFDDYFSEKTEGKFKNLEEYETHLREEAKKEVKIPQLSERLKKLAEMEEKGQDIFEVLRYEGKGYDKLTPETENDAKKLLFEKWELETPGITVREMEFKFKKKYSRTLEEDASEEEREESEIAKIELMRDAKGAQKFLLDKKKEFELPQNKNNQPTDTEVAELVKVWKDTVAPVVSGYKEEKIKLADGSEFSFSIGDEERKSILDTMITPANIVQRHIVNGKTDLNGLRRTALIQEHFDKILNAYGSKRFEEGKKATLDAIENPSRQKNGVKTPDGKPITDPVQAAAADKRKKMATA